MSKRCPDCGFVNDDSRIYCSSCGELLDPELRLIKNLETSKSSPQKSARQTAPIQEEPSAPKSNYDENYVPPKTAREKKSNPLLWVILGLAVVAVVAVVAIFALS